jgi:hypothetical protein
MSTHVALVLLLCIVVRVSVVFDFIDDARILEIIFQLDVIFFDFGFGGLQSTGAGFAA